MEAYTAAIHEEWSSAHGLRLPHWGSRIVAKYMLWPQCASRNPQAELHSSWIAATRALRQHCKRRWCTAIRALLYGPSFLHFHNEKNRKNLEKSNKVSFRMFNDKYNQNCHIFNRHDHNNNWKLQYSAMDIPSTGCNSYNDGLQHGHHWSRNFQLFSFLWIRSNLHPCNLRTW